MLNCTLAIATDKADVTLWLRYLTNLSAYYHCTVIHSYLALLSLILKSSSLHVIHHFLPDFRTAPTFVSAHTFCASRKQ